MNEEQKEFLDFFIERVIPGNERDAQQLLDANFSQQQAGPPSKESISQLKLKLLPLIKNDRQVEVAEAIDNFISQINP